MLSYHLTNGLPVAKRGNLSQFIEVKHNRLLVFFYCGNKIIFHGVYARGKLKQLRKLEKAFKYKLLPRPQLKGIEYTTPQDGLDVALQLANYKGQL